MKQEVHGQFSADEKQECLWIKTGMTVASLQTRHTNLPSNAVFGSYIGDLVFLFFIYISKGLIQSLI